MPRTRTLAVPTDYFLPRDYCSYGYFLLWPNHWDVHQQVFSRALELASGPVLIRVSQGRPGEPRAARVGRELDLSASRMLRKADWRAVLEAITRMLRLDEDAAAVRAFHRLDPRWKKPAAMAATGDARVGNVHRAAARDAAGRGRLMRSASLFEDVIKTVTSCNVQWPSTIVMNRRLCEVVGVRVADAGPVTHAFPSPRALARTRATTLRSRCRTGYRDARIIELARMFAQGEIDAAWLADPATPDEAVYEALIEWPGIGPYAAANIMQLLGRYSRLPLDTESVRHGKTVLAMKGTDRQIMKKIDRHFAPFGAHKFRSYWFELWAYYEARRGPSWTWDRDTTGTTFTARQL
jgi:3-methyladenine DNA glycosylase/8-oxoguanine DNA glycosylase